VLLSREVIVENYLLGLNQPERKLATMEAII
jgi:hypothetical protein